MKRLWFAALVAAMLMLSGCSAAQQIEGQAYAVTMAIDREENGQITLSVQMPSLGGEGGEADKENGGYVISSATGFSFDAALNLLNATVPRVLNLSQLKSVIVSEKLASEEDFKQLLSTVKEHYLIYGEAALIVCEGRAKDMLEQQKTLIGVRLSDSVVTAMERYVSLGSIPKCTLTGVVQATESFYADPVAVFAAQGDKEDAPVLDSAHPGESYAGALRREGDNKDEYYGTALFKDGRMVGKLTGAQTKVYNLLCGTDQPLAMIFDTVPMNVRRESLKVSADLSGDVPRITVRLSVLVTMVEKGITKERIAAALRDRLDELTALCQEKGVDPFGYGKAAVSRFATVKDWLDYDWKARFQTAVVGYDVNVRIGED